MSSPLLRERMARLDAERVPYVHAVVVRAQVPTSAKAGDDALVFGDGVIEGFVGGRCAESSVRVAALDTLAQRAPMLLRVLPEGEAPFPDSHGARVVVNPCLSGGALEIFLEPKLPPPLVCVSGASPVADALLELGSVLGYEVRRGTAVDAGATAVVVASHGTDELPVLRAALEADVPYVALVASRRRGAGVLDELRLGPVERGRISTPAGLDIAARTAPEVALSILAEIVPVVRAGRVPAAAAPPAPVQALDPVCGMTVVVGPEVPHLSTPDGEIHFCSVHCRDSYATRVGQSA